MRPALALAACLLLTGCAAVTNSTTPGCQPNAVPYSLRVAPAAGQSLTPDHSATPPGNQEQFQAVVAPDPGPGCPVPQWLALANNATWTVSDPNDVQISSAVGGTNGLATCVGATEGAATVSAVVTFNSFTISSSSSITCK